MARVLILSSYVASSRVGGGAQALALARLGIEPILIPTVLFGRHPGHGPPGGRAVEPEVMAEMLEGVAAQGLYAALDAVITGHFSTPEQVELAAKAIGEVRAASAARIVVDPIMGDDGRLYVREPVAAAIARELVPRADLVAPNAWELGRLTGVAVEDPKSALAAARRLGKPTLVSSVRSGDDIGVLYVDARQVWLGSHASAPAAPHGVGDLLTALFTAGLAEGLPVPETFRAAVSGVAEAVLAAAGAPELAVQALPRELAASPRVKVEFVHG
ncbi:MAG TPA: PfkB family carbohydrate kinase [Caulobacteraceae bacterium]|nr:PfkB family carbohydrate kinase [Caulobacteraceae bacterium]